MACQHLVGYIPDAQLTATDWNDGIKQFVEKVLDFNIRGQRYQINHPGFIVEFKYCPLCGQPIDSKSLGLVTYADEFERQSRSSQ